MMQQDIKSDLAEVLSKRNFREIAFFYHQNFGFSLIPIQVTSESKKPLNKWKAFQDKTQTNRDIDSMKWDSMANGIAMINDGKFISLDFDKCKDENYVFQVADDLGINSFIVKTGFGFHIHLELDDLDKFYDLVGNESSVYTLQPKNVKLLDHIEIRLNRCYTALPPSRHYIGKDYAFISGLPEDEPQKVSAEKLFETIQKHFLFNKNIENMPALNNLSTFDDLLNGKKEGHRHKALITLFGLYFKQGLDKEFIMKTLEMWNKRNSPPIDDKELKNQINDLWKRYAKGLDNVFHQFPNCLLALSGPVELKLKKILCYSVVQFGSDPRLINKYELSGFISDYHNECKKFVERYEHTSKRKDQIVRIGEEMIRKIIEKEFDYDLFSVYVGIVSYLGRDNKPAKPISNDIISYRALGYKTEVDYLMSETTQKPLSKYKIRKFVGLLEKMNFIRTYKLRRSVMTYYSTKISSKKQLADYVTTREKNKILKKIEDEKLRKEKLEELSKIENELKQLRDENKKTEKSLSLHYS